MIKRLISASASEISSMNKIQLLESIEASEGRILVTECIPSMANAAYDVTQMELGAAFGSDLMLINMFDLNNPQVCGMKGEKEGLIKEIKKLTGRPVGINLEPVDPKAETIGMTYDIPEGRRGTGENAKKALSMGVDFIVLTGNPGMGVSNEKIIESLQEIKKAIGDDLILVAGKMHASGSRKEAGSGIISKAEIKRFVMAGASIVLLPAPGTVPGVTLEFVRDYIAYIHELGALAMTAIGTSQEGADEATIREIALMCKMAGADLHHMGDGGSSPGMTNPENIMAYSIAIRGKRHTYNRMAMSINR